MRLRIKLIIALLWGLTGGASAAMLQPKWVRPVTNRHPDTARLNCQIVITLITIDQRRIRMGFKTHLRNARECRALASFHRPNFEPSRVAAKQVAYRWLESAKRVARR